MGGGGPGKGKVLLNPLTSEEKRELRESNDSSQSVWRKMDPPPVNGAPGEFEEEEVETNVDHLMRITAQLREKNRKLVENVAELRMDNLDLEDNFRSLRISTTTKLKRFAKAICREDLFKPPSP